MLLASKSCTVTVETPELIDTAVSSYADRYDLSKEKAYRELLVFALETSALF